MFRLSCKTYGVARSALALVALAGAACGGEAALDGEPEYGLAQRALAPCGADDGSCAIAEKHSQLGGDNGVLGRATSRLLTTGSGYMQNFQNGKIYWSEATSAHVVRGAILSKWEQWGAEGGWLGYPTTDESNTPDGVGRFNIFQGGGIYWTAETNARVVYGALYTKWAELGWETGSLGYPVDDSRVAPDGVGFFSYFKGGAIYWSPETGAHEVRGAILQRWRELGAERSSLGYPISDEGPVADGGAGGRVSFFEGGPLYWSACSGVTTAQPTCGAAQGSCASDRDCSGGFTCNNPYGNARGRCVGALESYTKAAQGRVEWRAGQAHNVCVLNSVVDEVNALADVPSTRVDYHPREEVPLPPDGAALPDLGTVLNADEGHVQSVARIPAMGGDRWMAVSISKFGAATGGIMFVELGQLDGNAGRPFRGGLASDTTRNVSRAYYSLPSHHPGGISLMGRTLTVAAEQDTQTNEGSVYFYDVSDPLRKRASSALIAKMPLQSRFYPPRIAASEVAGLVRPTAVSIVPMASGGYLMALTKSSQLWLYLTEYEIGPNMKWYFHDKLTIGNGGNIENVTFVTECDGAIFLLVTGNTRSGLGENGVSNQVTTYRVVKSGDKLSVNAIDSRGYFQEQGYGDFRAAANFYVSPQGELVLYAGGRDILTEAPNYRIAEYLVPSFCPNLDGC
jgi:hypothetical protein